MKKPNLPALRPMHPDPFMDQRLLDLCGFAWVTLNSLDVFAECPSCQALKPIALEDRPVKERRATTLGQFRARLRCTACGHRGADVLLYGKRLRYGPWLPRPPAKGPGINEAEKELK